MTTILTEDEDRQTTDDEGTGNDGEQVEDVEANRGQMQGVLEAVFIRKHNPNLCIQKENVTKLRLFS